MNELILTHAHFAIAPPDATMHAAAIKPELRFADNVTLTVRHVRITLPATAEREDDEDDAVRACLLDLSSLLLVCRLRNTSRRIF